MTSGAEAAIAEDGDPKRVLVFTQGDPAGIGPELLLKLLSLDGGDHAWRSVVVADRQALEAHGEALPGADLDRFVELGATPDRSRVDSLGKGEMGLLLPVQTAPPPCDGRTSPGASSPRTCPGKPTPGGAEAALRALDRGSELVRAGVGDALITAPVNKAEISRHCRVEFRGHTDYLAHAAGLKAYGEDYLMAFLTTDLQVALLNVHLSLREALAGIDREATIAALRCLDDNAGGRIALAGLNPHAGEAGLLGDEEIRVLRPAVEEARRQGIDVEGPLSADSVFARARRGDFDWVLALYHDQGLIAVKTASFGAATNWTMGLPYLRTSVDHGTAYDIAGRGEADVGPLRQVVQTTLRLLDHSLPRRSLRAPAAGRHAPSSAPTAS